MWVRKEIRGARSALVAIGALLGVEIFRRHAKHVVALDADAMNHAGAVRQGGVFRGVRRRAWDAQLMAGILA